MKEAHDILIRDYFNQVLDEEGIKAFNDLYNQDAAFKTLADQIEIEVLGIRSAERIALKGKFDNWEKEIPSNPINWKLVASISVAAMIIIGVGLTYFSKPSNHEIYYSYFEPYVNYEYTAVRGIESTDVRAKAFIAYDENNYSEALKLFTDYHSKNPDDMAVQFFRSIALMELEQYQEALNGLEIVYQSDNNDYAEAANWYIGLIYVRLGNEELAKTHFDQLTDSKDFGTKAQAILQEL